jgi:hypothetical protein
MKPLKGRPRIKTKILSKKNDGLGRKHHIGLGQRGVEKCFFLTSSLIG